MPYTMITKVKPVSEIYIKREVSIKSYDVCTM